MSDSFGYHGRMQKTSISVARKKMQPSLERLEHYKDKPNLQCFLNKESNDIEIKRIGGYVVRSMVSKPSYI
ncbi:hypothetical protein BpHYR1_043944 [Brachionus plicatilis]|uniref:Uncharacterized protein n=1 Tax=Brachionus plicatilis TaxID=10195 RepID=A0A3M7PCV0_BRAPC|nr:hypothetical protein BpHYR1_043944 [Brachionus plicatilis]